MISINGLEIKPTIFPDGTSQIWNLPQSLFSKRDIEILWNFEREEELIHLHQVATLLRSQCSVYTPITLEMPYCPYARQDHPISNQASFALYSFAKIINSLDLCIVYVDDAHSEQAEILITNLISRPPMALIKRLRHYKYDYICFPDFGARERYSELFHDVKLV